MLRNDIFLKSSIINRPTASEVTSKGRKMEPRSLPVHLLFNPLPPPPLTLRWRQKYPEYCYLQAMAGMTFVEQFISIVCCAQSGGRGSS